MIIDMKMLSKLIVVLITPIEARRGKINEFPLDSREV